jgi:CubicO group peptidase (beta-lactamase class C family)
MRTVSPAEVGLDPERLARLTATIDRDVAERAYDGASILVARRGGIALQAAIGFADRGAGRQAKVDDVFHCFSITKTFTAALVLSRIERGELALTTRVADVIPEFGNRGKQRITVLHLLTHTSGLPVAPPPLPPESLGDLAATVAGICAQGIENRPGTAVYYSPLTAHAVLAEMVRRLDGTRSFRAILQDEILGPLGLRDTCLGARAQLASRRVPIATPDRREGLFPPEALEGFNFFAYDGAEIPAAGLLSTTGDLGRFAEALRRGGELDGVRILGPTILQLATTNQTGLRPNLLWNYAREMRGWDEFPAYIGLTFWLRGEGIFTAPFGTLASPGTFGHLGAGTAMYWIDPSRELVFVCLTAGAMEESYSMERFQRLSDLVHAAVVN